MKLIDAVVEKYPIGTWPVGMLAVGPMYTFNAFVGRKIKDDEYVTREQYEAALAASKPEWDGEGLPPVGVEFEHSFHANGFSSWHWRRCTAVGKHGVLCVDEKDTELYLNDTNNRFRPIRSEADKKRDEAIAEMVKRIGITHESAATCYEICIRID